MGWDLLITLLPYLLAAAISAGVGYYAWQRRALPGASAFGALAFAETSWGLAYALQRMAVTLPMALLWNALQYSASLILVLAYFRFSYTYTGRRAAPARLWGWLLAGAFLLIALVWTDPGHGLFRQAPHLAGGELEFKEGGLYPLYTIFILILIAYSSYLLGENYLSAPRIYRAQVGSVLLGVLIPWLLGLAAWLGVLDSTPTALIPLAFGPSSLLMFWALFRYHLFDVAPIARDMLVERMRDGVIVLDRRRRIVDFNPAAREILGLSNMQSPGKTIGRELPALQQFVIHLTESPNARAELSLDVLGMPSRYEGSATPLYDNLGALSGHLVIMRDITEQKRAEEKLHQLALTDYLTGILNRRAFFELAVPEFERARRYRHPLSFILFDVDNFKKVNDTYGHLVGDLVLENIAHICQRSLREVDKLARYGGEEFMVMLPETGAEGARETAERLRRAVEGLTVPSRHGPVSVTISLGVSEYDPGNDDSTLDFVLGEADQALYHAKQSGRNRVSVWQNLSEVADGQTGRSESGKRARREPGRSALLHKS